jgi:hypothetical protein
LYQRQTITLTHRDISCFLGEEIKEELKKAQTIEEYEMKYNALDEDVKPFFASPQELRQTQQNNILIERQKLDARILYLEEKIKKKEEAINRKRVL